MKITKPRFMHGSFVKWRLTLLLLELSMLEATNYQ